MATDVVMPQMGESITEGTLTKWLKKVGDTVQRDEPLFEISTDKVDTEIPSPAAGTLGDLLVQEGQTVQVNAVVARIDEGGVNAAAPPAPAAAAAPPPPPQPAVPAAPAPAAAAPPAVEKPAPAPPPPPVPAATSLRSLPSCPEPLNWPSSFTSVPPRMFVSTKVASSG